MRVSAPTERGKRWEANAYVEMGAAAGADGCMGQRRGGDLGEHSCGGGGLQARGGRNSARWGALHSDAGLGDFGLRIFDVAASGLRSFELAGQGGEPGLATNQSIGGLVGQGRRSARWRSGIGAGLGTGWWLREASGHSVRRLLGSDLAGSASADGPCGRAALGHYAAEAVERGLAEAAHGRAYQPVHLAGFGPAA
jgi:hypothetical protein